MWFLFFITELIILFFLSRIVTKALSYLFFRITHSQKVTVSLMALLFFPGTVLHELSHFFMAAILMVKTGAIEFIPKVFGDTVKLGSVEIAKTDPFRRFLIGVAPVIIGVMTLTSSLWYIASFWKIQSFTDLLPYLFQWKTLLLLYIVFEIGNTMFSSKKDMEGAGVLGIVVGIFLVVGYFLGIEVPKAFIEYATSQQATYFLRNVCFLLLIPILIDLGIIMISKIWIRN